MVRFFILSLCTAFCLVACGEPAPHSVPLSTEERLRLPPNIDNGRRQFRACAVCHNAGKNAAARIGPTLWGIYDSPAAAQTGFSYSKALERADIVWDEPTLHAWLIDCQDLVPGNRMQYVGEPDEANRRDLIAYLKTLQDGDNTP